MNISFVDPRWKALLDSLRGRRLKLNTGYRTMVDQQRLERDARRREQEAHVLRAFNYSSLSTRDVAEQSGLTYDQARNALRRLERQERVYSFYTYSLTPWGNYRLLWRKV